MPWSNSFPAYLWGNPSARAALLVLACAAAAFLLALWTLAHFRAGYGDELFELEQDLLPRRTYAFSPTGVLEVYEEGVRVMRAGNCVSPMLHDVWSAEGAGSPDARVVRVKWLDGGNGPATTDIRCGRVDEDSFLKLREMLEHYGKE